MLCCHAAHGNTDHYRLAVFRNSLETQQRTGRRQDLIFETAIDMMRPCEYHPPPVDVQTYICWRKSPWNTEHLL